MNSEQVLVSKRLINFAINYILEVYMLENQLGTFNTVLKTYEYSDEEYKELRKLIETYNLPDGYYQLCDLIGRSYV